MVHETIDGTYRQTNLLNEPGDYLTKREELRLAEIELMRQRERVAELRRQLPQGATVQDYAFEEGPAALDAGDTPTRTVRLSELFTMPDRALVIYHLMHGKKQAKPCPMCTAWIDGFNGVAGHLAQNINLAVVAAADTPVLRAHARARGWNKLRLLSAGPSTFKYDLGSEDREGKQDSAISVFSRESDGTLRHFYSAHPRMASDISGARHRSPQPDLASAGPHPAGTRRLVCETRISKTGVDFERMMTKQVSFRYLCGWLWCPYTRESNYEHTLSRVDGRSPGGTGHGVFRPGDGCYGKLQPVDQ